MPAKNNRTLSVTSDEAIAFSQSLRTLRESVCLDEIRNSTVCQDLFDILEFLPGESIDLVIADPPYNMDKDFAKTKWSKMSNDGYSAWLETWIPQMKRILKPEGSIYVCGDWHSSPVISRTLEKHFHIQNRITWEREKGRGAKRNWKNCSEDIWFATCHKTKYTFNVDAVKLRRRVIAPYTDGKGRPKDWAKTAGGNFRLTHPSNLWTDLSVPFWSMPENTPHPTQKPEKLLAKIILASSNPGDVVFDPFLGSGTTSATAVKLDRDYIGVEINEEYAVWAEKRIKLARADKRIQGYHDGLFYERNSAPPSSMGLRDVPATKEPEVPNKQSDLFG